MIRRTILEPRLPATQSVEAVKSLVEFVTIKPCAKLSAIFNLVNGMQLILSSKKDVYYMILQSCTCKTGKNHKICWHRRSLYEATGDAQKHPSPRG